jgi:hypothetical protein
MGDNLRMDVTIRVNGASPVSLQRWLDNELSYADGTAVLRGEVLHLDLHETASLHGVAQTLRRWQINRSHQPTLVLESVGGELEVTAQDPEAVERMEQWLGTEPVAVRVDIQEATPPARPDDNGYRGPSGGETDGYTGPTGGESDADDAGYTGPPPGPTFPTDV